MSECNYGEEIHAFGENGELSDGAQIAFNNFMSGTVNPAIAAASGGGGVTDHGALTGLSDDDHPQYALADGSRGSFATTAQGALADTSVQEGDPRLTNARTPTAHTHDDRYYTETEADGRFVRTVNGTGPDGAGDVAVSGGSSFELRGSGMPNGVVTADPGTYYTDTAGTNGAWRWIKKSGTENTGWECVMGDTGWRNLTASLNPAILHPAQGQYSQVRVRRTGSVVLLSVWLELADNLNGTNGVLTGVVLPKGFRNGSGVMDLNLALLRKDAAMQGRAIRIHPGGAIQVFCGYNETTFGSSYAGFYFDGSYYSPDPWPAVLPGIPA